MRPSTGSVSSPRDNEPAESLVGIIRAECALARTFESREQAAIEIFEHIECFHSRLRIHPALGWVSPCEFEEARAGENRLRAA